MDWITTSTILDGLKAFEGGDAWERLVQRFRSPIVAFVRDLGLAESDAEDVAQETLIAFAKAFREGRYDPAKGRLSHWLFGIAYRQMLRERRRSGRRESPVAARTDATGFFERIPDEARATELWDRRWEDAVLQECLQQVRHEVEPQTFEAFMLAVRDDRPAAEVAEALNISVKAVYNAKHRVLARVRSLREEFDRAEA